MQPHYVRDYRRLVRKLEQTFDRDSAMERAVGGDYDAVGEAELALLKSLGLRGDEYLVDVGCGSGRLATRLVSFPKLRYLGTDVVQSLLNYAEERCRRPDWRFVLVDGLSIPEDDNRAGIVTMFSVLTHLTEIEGFRYLADAARVVRPGGMIVASFLSPEIKLHQTAAGSWLYQAIARLRGYSTKNVKLPGHVMSAWAAKLGLSAQFIGDQAIGQSVCVYRKPDRQQRDEP
jgi:ubiquinone/menaquinone biosynthesis C-methylase UbiE